MPHVVHVFTVSSSLLFLSGQVAFMRARGFDVSIVASPDETLEAFGAREGIPVYGIDMPRRITPAGDLRSLGRLVALLRRIRPDVVHAHTPKGGLLGTMAATIARVPVRIYHMRGLPMMTARGRRRAILTNTERVSCNLATRVLCVSHSLRRYAIDARLVPERKIEVLLGGSGNGVDCDGRFDPDRLPADARATMRAELGIPDDALVVGFLGRIVRDKGVRELEAAWRDIRVRVPNAHLLMAGPFETEDAIPDECRRALETDPRVHLLPFTRDTPRLYAAMDVVTLPTYREGFPNVPLEAAAMRLPTVATRIPGCVDAIVDGVTGLLVPPGESAPLAEALLRYLEDPALRRAHGEAGRARVLTSFRPVRIWEAIEGLYRAEIARAEARAVPLRARSDTR